MGQIAWKVLIPVSDRPWLESLEAIMVFVIPILLILPFYVTGLIEQSSANIIMYCTYIVLSIAVTKYNRRSLEEIGITRKKLFPSAGNSVLSVLAAVIARFVLSGLRLSTDISSWTAVTYNLLFWTLSGVGQEILFRGLILFSLKRWKGWRVALLISSVLFGLVHVLRYPNISAIMVEIFVGVAWGWIALEYENMIGPAIAHSLFNFLFSFVFTH